jgi:hypothetical protein
MKLSLTALFLGVVAVMVCPAQSQDPKADQPFTINISTSNPSVKTNKAVEIKIRLTNTSNRPIDLSEVRTHGCSMNQGYRYDIRDANGRVAEILPDIQPRTESRGRVTATVKVHTLNPGEALEATADLSQCYDMATPGEYTIQLSRENSEDLTQAPVKSNKITVTVAPAEGQQ